MTKYDVKSPDGISINRSQTYENVKEAGDALDQFVSRYQKQGYYSSNYGRIPIEELAFHCNLVVINMTNKETIEQAVQTSLDGLFEDLSEEFNLPTGDISPNQMQLLEAIQDQLSDLVLEWVEQNTPKKLKPLFDSMKGD